MLCLDLAGQSGVFSQTVNFEVKGGEGKKWEYKATPTGSPDFDKIKSEFVSYEVSIDGKILSCYINLRNANHSEYRMMHSWQEKHARTSKKPFYIVAMGGSAGLSPCFRLPNLFVQHLPYLP